MPKGPARAIRSAVVMLFVLTIAACNTPQSPTSALSAAASEMGHALGVVTPPSTPVAFILDLPVDPMPISSGYGQRWGRLHEGLDFDGEYGDPIYAASDGVVVFVGRRNGYGRTVEILHVAGIETRYAHMSAFADTLQEGQEIAAGTPIGYIGTSGRVTGAHLHFEVLIDGLPQDPLRHLALDNIDAYVRDPSLLAGLCSSSDAPPVTCQDLQFAGMGDIGPL